ncbi:MAG TPA: carboxypeptidase-like regulatory domain-containing protein [Draconibacterium sp.]|nr:carboxypeptidase-like regulatory domain-containing protein [Draconibacterium sp.]
MKKLLVLISGLILFSFCFAQNVILDGVVFDAVTNQPLQYATIEIFSLRTGTITDKNGEFKLELTPNDLESDTIEFSCLGYEREKITIAEYLNSGNHKVLLKEKPVTIGEVKVIPKKYTTSVLGVTDKKSEHLQYANVFGANKGNFIYNNKSKPGWIKSVSYFIHPDGNPTTPFRVRIYAKANNKKPGNDLLLENVVVSAKKPGWCEVDISQFNVLFPTEGAFVMMEWINSGEGFYFEKELQVKGKNGKPDRVEKKKYYGQTLGTVSKKGGVAMWGNTLGNEWIPYDFDYRGNFVSAMIQVEIDFEKN